MNSENVIPLAQNANVEVKSSLAIKGSPGKKNQKKVPKRVHKAEREKQKREHLNDLFFELSNALDIKEPNNGKASVLCEATRLLKDLLSQIESLRKENASLLSESHYVNVEKDELKEENSTLETQIGRLQNELEARVIQSKPDLNAPLPPTNCLAMASSQEPVLSHQPHAVFVVPLPSDLPEYSHRDSNSLICKRTRNLRKPHARYPTSGDSWLPPLLRQQPNDSNGSVFSPEERGLDTV